MPLPDNGQPWPPTEFADALAQMHTWGAWYSGNPDHLARAYEAIGHRLVNTPDIRPSQLRGGVVGTFARWFWGQPVPPGEKRVKLHVPIAADLAATSADLLFSEPITLTTEDKAAQAQLDKLLDDQLHATLLEAAELSAALSGVYLRVVWDAEVRPEGPWLSAVHADAAWPEWRYGRLTAVTFVRQLSCENQVVMRHLERHESGKILHGLYQGTQTSLGRAMALGDAEETKDLGDVDTGVTELTAVYIPNIRPNRQWRHLPACAPFGRSDFDGVEGFMDALDEVYTSWMRDIRLAKARIIVPEVFLQDRGPGKGALFDPDREAYESLNMIPNAEKDQLTLQQFSIRVEEHQKTALDLVGRIVTTAGYSQQTFGLTGDVAVTATEVAARERKSLITRDKKIKYVRPQLQAILWTLAKVGQVHFRWPTAPSEAPTVNFPDAVQQDPASLSQTLAQLETARAVSTKTKVQMLHPDWDDTQVGDEVDLIQAADKPLANPDTYSGKDFPPPGDKPKAPPAG